MNASLEPFLVGAFGVDLFFIISGFIMWTVTSAQPTTPSKFLQRRIIRIVPIYWIITLISAFVSTNGGFHIEIAQDYERLFRSLFFIPQFHETYPSLVAPIVIVGWTLNLEMMFYTLFALCMFFKGATRLYVLCGVLFFLACFDSIGGSSSHPAMRLYADSIVAEFGMGALVGYAYMNGSKQLKQMHHRLWAAGALLIISGVALLAAHDWLPSIRAVYWGIPALLIFCGFLLLEPLMKKHPIKILKFLGDASYSIYLTHLMAMVIGQALIGAWLAADHPLLALTTEVAFAAAFGAAVYWFLEKPATKTVKRMMLDRDLGIFARFRAKLRE